MSDAIGIISSATSAINNRAATVAASSVAAAPDTATTLSTPPALSPRLRTDPVAGLITEYLNSKGDVETQNPSAVAVAYLRVGLTATGERKTESSGDKEIVA